VQKSSCYISDNDINISCNSELFNNIDYDIDKLSHIVHKNPENKLSLSLKIAKWAIKDNITLSILKNILSII